MLRQSIRYAVLILLTFASVLLYSFDNNFSKEIIIKKLSKIHCIEEEEKALVYLNEIRGEVGLNRLKSNDNLNISSSNHANYLLKNNKIGHFEESEKNFFTGKFASNRSVFSGYNSYMVIENISRNNFTHKESIDGLMGAIYHRFGFLNFHIDEIGISIKQDSNHLNKSAFVYNMGNSLINNLCKEATIKNSNHIFPSQPMNNILCANKKVKVDRKDFLKVSETYNQNVKTVKYPFDGQSNVPPVFYEEFPDPLPDYSVSGFPISLSFDRAYTQNVEMIYFKLYDKFNKEITDIKFYDHILDPNQQFTKFQFAIFPLKRLDWNSNYKVKAKYIVDGKIKSEQWSFRTKSFNYPLNIVDKNKKNKYKIAKGETAIFYFPPLTKRDTLGDLLIPSELDVSFIDKNTIKVVAKKSFSSWITLDIKNYQLMFRG